MSSFQSFIRWARKVFRRVFRRDEDARMRDIADVLADVPLFSSLPRGMLLDLAGAVHERTYRRDEYIYYEGDPGIGMYIVRRGSIRMLVTSEDGTVVEVGEVGEREILGPECLVGSGAIKRSESAQAASETKVLGLFSPEFRTMLSRNPRTGAAVALLLARYFALRVSVAYNVVGDETGRAQAASLLAEAGSTAHARIPDAATV